MADGSRTSSPTVSAQGAHAAWVRWVMPSIADLIFLAILFALACTPLSVRLLGDAGIGWHIRTGQHIIAAHTIPRADLFSSSMQGQRWFAWEWLYDVIVGELDRVAGLNGVTWLTALLIAGVFGSTFRILTERGTPLFIAVLLTLLAMAASMIHFLARPHVVSWLLTLAWFWVLTSTEKRTMPPKLLWVLPLIMLLWVNVHGGFVFGFVLLGIFWLGSLWDWLRTKEARLEDIFERIAAAKRSWSLFWIGLVSAGVSLVNPYGWRLHAHIYSYLTNRFLMDHIEEFQSPNFHGIAQKCFLLLLVITIAALAARGRGLRFSEILIILIATSSALYSSRNVPVASILLVVIVGPLLASIRFAPRFFAKMTQLESGMTGHLWPVLGTVLTLGIALHGGRLASAQWMDAHFNPMRMPVGAVNYMEEQHLGGPILSIDSWGGYFIYRLYPRDLVVLDDRHDLYGADFMQSYLSMIRLQARWQDFLHAHGAACLVLPREAALTNLLLEMQLPFETPDWVQVYDDKTAVVFIRRKREQKK